MVTKYRVVIQGLKPSESVNLVAIRLGTLFKLPPEKIIPVLSRLGTPIKAGIDLERAVKYQSALENAGCDCIVEPDVEVARSPEKPTAAHQPAATPTAANNPSFVLLQQKLSEHLSSVTSPKKAIWAFGTTLVAAFLASIVSIPQSSPDGDSATTSSATTSASANQTCEPGKMTIGTCLASAGYDYYSREWLGIKTLMGRGNYRVEGKLSDGVCYAHVHVSGTLDGNSINKSFTCKPY